MPDTNLMPARTLVGFGDRRFFIFPNEIITFLISCDKIGISSTDQMVTRLEEIKLLLKAHDQPEINTIFMEELILLLQGLIYEEH